MAQAQPEIKVVVELGDEPVRICTYDSGWPLLFLTEYAALQVAIGERASGGIHHVGSSAIPGVDAEPVIDVMVGCRDGAGALACFEPLTELGYRHECRAEEGGARFLRDAGEGVSFDLRLVTIDDPRYWEALAFRDHLRGDRQVALGYAGMKRDLASRHAGDRRLYTAAKVELIQIVLASI